MSAPREAASTPTLSHTVHAVDSQHTSTGLIALTGATGYIGGRLLPQLEAAGLQVRCLARRPEHLQGRVGEYTEVKQFDVNDPSTIEPALTGVHTAYYLIHSLGSDGDFADEDRRAADHFAAAAKKCGVKRIIYLGGLGDPDAPLSKHLRSRQETGERLLASGAQVIEFRTSIIIGSGSLSFELVRALVERLPVMVTPRWVRTPTQPIAVEDVLSYLLAGLDLPPGPSEVIEIGGPDVRSYQEIMTEYAAARNLWRWMIPVPVLTPYLSSLWLGLVTPVYARVGRQLVDGLRNPTVVRSPAGKERFNIQPRGLREAILRSMVLEDASVMQTRWSDAMSSGRKPHEWGGTRFGNRLVDSRARTVNVTPAEAFAPIRRIGGQTGWYYATWLWSLRGLLDLLVGGVGMRRGRTDPEHLRVGSVVDCWRVEAYDPPRLLRLSAEMRLPGRAWLVFEVTPEGEGSTIRQTAIFDPVGLTGLAYWYSVWPLHELVFAGMLKGIAQAAEARSIAETHPQPQR